MICAQKRLGVQHVRARRVTLHKEKSEATLCNSENTKTFVAESAGAGPQQEIGWRFISFFPS